MLLCSQEFMGRGAIFSLKVRKKSQEIKVSVAAFFFQLWANNPFLLRKKHKMTKKVTLLFGLPNADVIVYLLFWLVFCEV